MCLALVALGLSPQIPLLIIGNRDEFHGRPTAPAQWWGTDPDLFAGRDLQAGGTWFGITRNGRFGLVTNYREHPPAGNFASRGALLGDFLTGTDSPSNYLASVAAATKQYAGFNLVVGTVHDKCMYASNRAEDFARELPAGIYAVSNALLDTPWPKLIRVRNGVADWFQSGQHAIEDLFLPLMDRETTEETDADLDFLDPHIQKALTAPFIVGESYGTRSTTLALVRNDQSVEAIERRFDPHGSVTGETRETFALTR